MAGGYYFSDPGGGFDRSQPKQMLTRGVHAKATEY